MTLDEYLDAVEAAIRENFRPSDKTGSMTAAAAAYLVQQRVPVDRSAFGFNKFREVLNVLESRNKLRTGLNSKNAFSIWLADASPSQSKLDYRHVKVNRWRLLPQVWRAFVESPHNRGTAFFDKSTGTIVYREHSLPESKNWLEIPTLSDAEQRKLAEEWLKRKQLDTVDTNAALASETWYTDLPSALALKSRELVSEWNRHRTSCIVEKVRDWHFKNGILEQFLFEAHDDWPKTSQPVAAQGNFDDDDLREMLLNAVRGLSTEDLLKIRFPAESLVALLRPDLLQ